MLHAANTSTCSYHLFSLLPEATCIWIFAWRRSRKFPFLVDPEHPPKLHHDSVIIRLSCHSSSRPTGLTYSRFAGVTNGTVNGVHRVTVVSGH